MDFLKHCPECGKQLSKSRKYCACGWKIAEIKECEVVDRTCAFIEPEGRCRNLGSIAPHGSNSKWFCGKHWYEAMNNMRRKF